STLPDLSLPDERPVNDRLAHRSGRACQKEGEVRRLPPGGAERTDVMSKFSKAAIAAPAVIGAMAVTLMAATPADAQSRHRDRGDDRGQDAIIGAVVGGLAGALIGNGDGTYIAGGALAGAALGASSSNGGGDCNYYRGGRCYR